MKCKTTHHTGCECHEAGWAEKLKAKDAEIERLNLLIKIADELITNENAKEDWINVKQLRIM